MVMLIVPGISKVSGAVEGLAGAAGASAGPWALGSAMLSPMAPANCCSVRTLLLGAFVLTWWIRQTKPGFVVSPAPEGRAKLVEMVGWAVAAPANRQANAVRVKRPRGCGLCTG